MIYTVEYIFSRSVTNTNGCIIWTGASSRDHGMVCGGDYVHVIVYEHYYGKVPNGKEVGHKCDVGLCVNPEHLEAITRQKNIQDAFTRHRFQRAKYDEPDLIALRNGTLKVKEFAARFGVSVKHTYNIKLGHKVKWRG